MPQTNKRILVADDLQAIHEDFAKILAPDETSLRKLSGLAHFAPELAADPGEVPAYELSFVSQGEEAIRAVASAKGAGKPFAMVFLDVRMPPGIDGVETAERLMVLDEDLQIVLCTAYADYSFSEISRRFRGSSNFLILKKPFDPAEVLQVAHALCRKWSLAADNRLFIQDLEQKVSQRTVALERSREELADALRRAQSGENAKKAFLNCISHELYTPLNGITMGAELIADSNDPHVAELAQVISKSSESLQRLFNRVLLYCELENLPPGDRLQPVDLRSLATQVHDQFAPVAKLRGLAWQVDVEISNTVFIHGDGVKLLHLLEVLVENSFKFTDRGGVILRFTTLPGPGLEITVSDTGPGLPSDLAALLSQPFTLGDPSDTRRHGGLGLGLTLGGRLVEYFRGSLSYAATPGGGATFTVVLPAAC
ncbi:MAG: hybrid sensor histidine kinase/response regulator [Opitutaceae bacterium]|nr:hybrid sensor histidine kinase/response regulator [Opitutaceae bacterium]